MENANKFKVVRDITVLDCSTQYMFDQTKKHIADKYKGLGIADDAMLAELWQYVHIDISKRKYPTVVDLELIKDDTDTVNAALSELGDVSGRCTDKKDDNIATFPLYKKVDQLPVFIGYNSPIAGNYNFKIIANYNSRSDKGTILYTSIGWCDPRKDEEVDVETLQKGKPFFWSFVNWVKVYIFNSLNNFEVSLREVIKQLEQGMPAATTTEKGAVKMAGKVDALADNATLAQTVQRLNTLIAQLKSAGIMSEN